MTTDEQRRWFWERTKHLDIWSFNAGVPYSCLGDGDLQELDTVMEIARQMPSRRSLQIEALSREEEEV